MYWLWVLLGKSPAHLRPNTDGGEAIGLKALLRLENAALFFFGFWCVLAAFVGFASSSEASWRI